MQRYHCLDLLHECTRTARVPFQSAVPAEATPTILSLCVYRARDLFHHLEQAAAKTLLVPLFPGRACSLDRSPGPFATGSPENDFLYQPDPIPRFWDDGCSSLPSCLEPTRSVSSAASSPASVANGQR